MALLSKPASSSAPLRARNAAATRVQILEQAIAEFASQGVAGARTAAIAEAAGVNKALLYYYFKDKQALYAAALEAVFSGFVEDLMPLLGSSLPAGEKLLCFARAHFEYLIQHPNYPRLIQQELLRAGMRGALSKDFKAISTAHFIPLHRAGLRVIEQGVSSGELRENVGANALSEIIGMNVFYFISAPIMRAVRGIDPFSPRACRAHIASALDFIGAALFAERRQGIALAQMIARAPSALPRRSPQRADAILGAGGLLGRSRGGAVDPEKPRSGEGKAKK